jgi:hypothetical protein
MIRCTVGAGDGEVDYPAVVIIVVEYYFQIRRRRIAQRHFGCMCVVLQRLDSFQTERSQIDSTRELAIDLENA